MKRIIMVCTGNTCRSPMAMALMKKALAKRGLTSIEVSSAGMWAAHGERASSNAILQMSRMGLDLSAHRSRNLRDAAIDDALILCMTGSHTAAAKEIAPDADVQLLTECAGLQGPIPDPYGGGIDIYEHCAHSMKRAIEIIADHISKGDQ